MVVVEDEEEVGVAVVVVVVLIRHPQLTPCPAMMIKLLLWRLWWWFGSSL